MPLTALLRRELLEQAFPGQLRIQRAFENQASIVDQTATAAAGAVAATTAIQDATVLTLSANAALTNERILFLGGGLESADDGSRLELSVDGTVARSGNQYVVTFIPSGDCTLFLPLTGTLATRAGVETFQNKTLQAPSLSSIGDYADDTAAAAGGVPVGGVYRTGSALKVRVV